MASGISLDTTYTVDVDYDEFCGALAARWPAWRPRSLLRESCNGFPGCSAPATRLLTAMRASAASLACPLQGSRSPSTRGYDRVVRAARAKFSRVYPKTVRGN